MEAVRTESGLTSQVMHAMNMTEDEANELIAEQADYCMGLMSDGGCDIEDIEDAMMDMGIESDLMDEFLLRMC